MAKKGHKGHVKRIAIPKSIPITTKKQNVWIIRPNPGPHNFKFSMPLTVLLRDLLKVAQTQREVRDILNSRMVKVDGKIRTEQKFPVGLMDIVSLDAAGKYYLINIDRKGRLFPQEIAAGSVSRKLGKVVRKHTVKGGKINLTFHDGRNLLADNNVKVGDSVLLSLPDGKLPSVLKLQQGSRCLITEGKHAGTIATIKELISRKEKEDEAKLDSKEGEIITVAKYLFVVDDSFKGVERHV